jgi:hypothetical protein
VPRLQFGGHASRRLSDDLDETSQGQLQQSIRVEVDAGTALRQRGRA